MDRFCFYPKQEQIVNNQKDFPLNFENKNNFDASKVIFSEFQKFSAHAVTNELINYLNLVSR